MAKNWTWQDGVSPEVEAPVCIDRSSDWLRRILATAELEEHCQAATAWADETGCIQKDLCNDECLQELIDHLSLKRFPAMRLRKARNIVASTCTSKGGEEDVQSVTTAASITETSILMGGAPNSWLQKAVCDLPELVVAETVVESEIFQDGQIVLVEFDGLLYSAKVQHQNPDGTLRVIYDVDGTYEDVKRERVSEEVLGEALAEIETTASECLVKASKSAKKRERKQRRDAACVAEEATKAPQQSLQSARPAIVSKQCVASEALMALVQGTWSVTREGCKAHAEVTIPNNCVGWIIGKNGSTIKHIEQTYLVTVKLVSQTVSIYGKRERVEKAMSYVDGLLW